MNDADKQTYFMNKGLQLDLGAHALSKVLARYELFNLVKDLPGDIVDCGVYRGASLFQWANFIELFAPRSQKTVFGFDSFEGFSNEQGDADKDSVSQLMDDDEKFVPRSVDELMAIANSHEFGHRIELIAGDATKTIPKFVEDHKGLRLSLLYLDFDVYEATIATLKAMYPLLVPGGILVLDEYGSKGWGESDAVDEYFRGQDIAFKRFGWSAGPAAYCVKTRI